jgi:hypothetical protein
VEKVLSLNFYQGILAAKTLGIVYTKQQAPTGATKIFRQQGG